MCPSDSELGGPSWAPCVFPFGIILSLPPALAPGRLSSVVSTGVGPMETPEGDPKGSGVNLLFRLAPYFRGTSG